MGDGKAASSAERPLLHGYRNKQEQKLTNAKRDLNELFFRLGALVGHKSADLWLNVT